MQVKKEDIKEKILRSARIEFLEHGYAEASLRVIAEKAGLTKGAVYSYFENKDALFCELAAPAVSFIEREFQQDICCDGSEEKKVDFFCSYDTAIHSFRSFANAVLENHESFKLLLFCSAGSSLQNYKERIISLYAQNFYKVLSFCTRTDASCNGVIHEMFVHTLATTYVSFLEEIVLHEPERAEVDEYVEQMAVFVHSGIENLYSHLLR